MEDRQNYRIRIFQTFVVRRVQEMRCSYLCAEFGTEKNLTRFFDCCPSNYGLVQSIFQVLSSTSHARVCALSSTKDAFTVISLGIIDARLDVRKKKRFFHFSSVNERDIIDRRAGHEEKKENSKVIIDQIFVQIKSFALKTRRRQNYRPFFEQINVIIHFYVIIRRSH